MLRAAPICLALLLAVLVFSPAAASLSARHEWNDPAADHHPHLTGYLVWKDGERRIAWDAGAASDDNVPPRPPEQQETTDAQQFMVEKWMQQEIGAARNCHGCPSARSPATGTRLVTLPGPEEFVSDPLPFDLHLNVTRGIQSVLYLQDHPQNDQPCRPSQVMNPFAPFDVEGGNRIRWFEPTLDLELRVGEKPLGGAYGGDHTIWFDVQPSRAPPQEPDGYGACYYQMHPEEAFLAKGSVLKLTVHHVEQQYRYPYGLAGDHRSLIRLWLYPTEELYYRDPQLVPQAPETDESAGTASGLALATLGMPVAGAMARARGRRAALLALALLIVVFAGCLGGKGGTSDGGDEATEGGRVSNTFVPDIDPEANEEYGSIRGTVHDDLYVALPEVHVSLLGSSRFTETDGNGRFVFRDLPPGLYRLRFDKTEYRSLEGDVEVKAKFVSRPDIMLYLVNPKSRDLRPHSHDYWKGLDEKSLGSQTIAPDCPQDLTNPCTLEPRFRINPKGDDPNTVMPGTAVVELTLDWDKEALAADRLGLKVESRHGNDSVFAPRGPGEPFRIATSWEMTDIGHAPYSGWVLEWFVPGVERRTFDEERRIHEAGYNPGTITVHAKILRGGALPLEPAHPDQWKGKDVIQLVKDWDAYFYVFGFLPPQDGECPDPFFECRLQYDYRNLAEKDPNLVPEGTQWVEVVATRNHAGSGGYAPRFYYKPANVPFHLSDPETLAGFKVVDAAPGSTDTRFVFRFPVVEGENDYVYAKRSEWQITFRHTDEEAAWMDFQRTSYTGGEQVIYQFDLFVHRDEMPQ